MLDWLKYIPLELRFASSVSEVRGPYFSTPRRLSFAMNDCELHLKAPMSTYAWVRGDGLFGGGLLNNNNSFFSAPLQSFNGDGPGNRWGYNIFFQRHWMLCGPWFTGPKARLFATGRYVGPYIGNRVQNKDFEGTSFFHPNVFENVLADYLRSRFGQSDNLRHKSYRAPVAWRRLQISPRLEAAIFDVEDRKGHIRTHSVERLVVFPIADDRFVVFEFQFSEHAGDPFFAQLESLVESIISTIHLELSPQIVAKLNELKASGVDTNLSEHFAPLNWHSDEEPDGESLQRISRD